MSKSVGDRESQRQRRRQPTPLPREERSEVKRIRSRSRDFLKAEESDDAFHNLQKVDQCDEFTEIRRYWIKRE